jgi:hypothetical protein
LRVQGSGFQIVGLSISSVWVQVVGLRVYGIEFRVQGQGFQVQV